MGALRHANQIALFDFDGEDGAFGGPDALFWGILGVLVMINVQLDARRGPRRPLDGSRGPLGLLLRALRVAGTFTTIVLLWSLWSSPGVDAWLDLLRRGLRR